MVVGISCRGGDGTVTINNLNLGILPRVKQLPLLTGLIVAAVMWIRGKKAWKNTLEYLDYKTLRNTIKEEKKQK